MFINTHIGGLAEPCPGRRWDRETIHLRLSARVAHFRKLGIAGDAPVFLHHGNTLEFFVDLLAVWLVGGCAVPIDPQKTSYEVENMARAAAPRFSLWLGMPNGPIADSLAGMGVRCVDTAEMPETAPSGSVRYPAGGLAGLDDPALILFTSGTTGDPKGVVHTHRSLRARWTGIRHALGTKAFRRTLCLLPTHHGHGLICNCLYPWLSGQDLFLTPAFSQESILRLGSILDENGVTFMSSVPSVWRMALKMSSPPRRNTLERVCCGSAPLTGALWKEIRDWTGTGDVYNAYGITETGSWLAGTTVPGFTPEDGLVGKDWGGVIKVLDGASATRHPLSLRECPPGEAGHVWVNTPALMKGYLGRDDLTRKVVSHGWYVTGDIGMIDERGLLYLKGRERDEINKGGMKVYPDDIDAAAQRHGSTLDACAFGIEDPLLGENVAIAVVLKENRRESLRGLVDWLRDRLGTRQLPVRWYVLEEIPRTFAGKVDRVRVAGICASREAEDIRSLYR
ncbi:MAG: class I adenylate-forming enzyme family protein [Thermodesulfobacteriota bacterium]